MKPRQKGLCEALRWIQQLNINQVEVKMDCPRVKHKCDRIHRVMF